MGIVVLVLSVLVGLLVQVPVGERPSLSTLVLAAREWRDCLLKGEGPSNAFLLNSLIVDGRPAAPAFEQWMTPAMTALPSAADPDIQPVTVAVLDSGVDASHPALDAVILPGDDVLNPCGDGRTDPRGHGTAVAGVVIRTAGLGQHLRILPIRVSFPDGTVPRLAVAAGVLLAVRQGADVINLSLSASSPSFPERAAIAYAREQGVIVVAAAGNEPGVAPRYPATLPGVIAVAAINAQGQVAGFSATPNPVMVAAPGVDVVVAAPGGAFVRSSGTSLAAPAVAGAAARLLAGGEELGGLTLHDWLIDNGWRARPVTPLFPVVPDLSPTDDGGWKRPATGPF